MKLGLQWLGPRSHPNAALGPTLAATAKAAENVGVSMFTLQDHLFQMDMGWSVNDPVLDSYTALGFVAAHTDRITLGALVTGVMFRYPGVLAKTMATLDVLSGGRAMFGVGAAWNDREHAGLGVPFPPVAERFERLEETLQICEQMWSDDNGPFVGAHYRLAETICSPRPVQQPRPPIIIGGSGERKTLRLVARYADLWSAFFGSAEELKHKIGVLARHCDAEGRDPTKIRRIASTLVDPLADVDGFLTTAEQFAGLGVDTFVVAPMFNHTDPVKFVEQVGEKILPRLTQVS